MRLIEEWSVLELSGELASTSANSKLYPSQAMPLYFEWQLRDELFDFGIIYGQKNDFLVLITADNAKAHTPMLAKSALNGWELLVATKSTSDDIIEFFTRYGYRRATEKFLQFTFDHELFSWNGISLSSAITSADRLGAKNLCVFSHDADPIYVLQRLN